MHQRVQNMKDTHDVKQQHRDHAKPRFRREAVKEHAVKLTAGTSGTSETILHQCLISRSSPA